MERVTDNLCNKQQQMLNQVQHDAVKKWNLLKPPSPWTWFRVSWY